MSFSSQAFIWAGASPNQLATWALTAARRSSPSTCRSSWGAHSWTPIIQVSDQPVEPSLGTIALTPTFLSVSTRLAMTCQVVPRTEVPDSKAWTSLV